MRQFLILIASIICVNPLFGARVLFDKTKNETASNADWVIGTSPTWRGGYSDFGAALRSAGHTTSTLTGTIDASDLNACDVYIIPEPQEAFSSSEKTAILNFVNGGGGLFIISNHHGSDRSNNGWDSRRVYNESLNTLANFGISFDANREYATPTNQIETPRSPLTTGVNQAGMWAGCSITATNGARAHIWLDGSHNQEMLVSAAYGTGRVVAIGDSSPFDDGTGASGDNLYDGWSEYDCATLGLNIVEWLANGNVASFDFVSQGITPSQPTNEESVTVFVNTNSETEANSMRLYWRSSSFFNNVSMQNTSANHWEANIMALPLGTQVDYYFKADVGGGEYLYPEAAPTDTYTYTVQRD